MLTSNFPHNDNISHNVVFCCAAQIIGVSGQKSMIKPLIRQNVPISMKSSALVSLFIKPFIWLRKIRGLKLVYTPLLAIVLFTMVMSVILGTLHLQEKNQQESSLFRELSFAKQRIQLRFANNAEALNSINREIAASAEDAKLRQLVREQADDLIMNNHEIVKIIWLDAESKPVWTVPVKNNNSDFISRTQNDKTANENLASTIELSKATSRAAFSAFMTLSSPTEEPIGKIGRAHV